MLGHVRHRGDEQNRIVDRNLSRLADRGFGAALIDVVGAEHIGDEQAVEPAPLEQFRQVGPVVELTIAPCVVARMRPQARRLMPDATHVEGMADIDMTLTINAAGAVSGASQNLAREVCPILAVDSARCPPDRPCRMR